MGISQHILEYTLRTMFKNNCSAYARAIGVRPHDLGVAIQSVRSGGKSGTMIDATLELYARDRLAFYTMIHAYEPEPGALPPSRCWGTKINNRARDKQLMCASSMKRLDELCLFSTGIVDRLEAAYCGVNCDQYAACSAYQQSEDGVIVNPPSDCPCVLFEKFTDALMKYAARNQVG